MARIHQRVKAKLQQENPKKPAATLLRKEIPEYLWPRYQWPRRHSFQTLINDLVTLKLLEKTGVTEPAQERGAGQPGKRREFSLRTWVRLTPGSEGQKEWADPKGYAARTYPNVRAPGRELATTITTPLPPRERRRRSGRAAGEAEREAPLRAAGEQLERRRATIHDRLVAVSQRATRVETFRAAERVATEFLTDARALYVTEQFPRAQEALGLLINCIAGLERDIELPLRRETAVNFCRNAARLLAESMTIQLQPPTPVAAPAPGRRGRRRPGPAPPEPQPVVEEAPPAIPTIELPERFTVRTAERLRRHLEVLNQLEEEAVEAEVSRLSDIITRWYEAAQEAEAEEETKDRPNEARLETLQERTQFLDELDDALAAGDLESAILGLGNV